MSAAKKNGFAMNKIDKKKRGQKMKTIAKGYICNSKKMMDF
ncbi:hypothetical protein [Methanolapillus ohkumae]